MVGRAILGVGHKGADTIVARWAVHTLPLALIWLAGARWAAYRLAGALRTVVTSRTQEMGGVGHGRIVFSGTVVTSLTLGCRVTQT